MNMRQRPARFWNNLPVGTKGFIVIVLPLLAFVSTILLIQNARQRQAWGASYVKRLSDLRSGMRDLREEVLAAELSIRGYALTHGDKSLKDYRAARARLVQTLDRLKRLLQDDPRQAETFRDLQASAMGHLAILETARQFCATHAEGEYPPRLVADSDEAIGNIKSGVRSLSELQAAVLASLRPAYERSSKLVLWSLFGSLALGCLASILGIALFTKGISNRIKELEKNAHRLRDGLVLPGGIFAKDEIGRAAMALVESSALLAEKKARLQLALETARISIWDLDTQTGRIQIQRSDAEESATQGFPESASEWIAWVHADETALVKAEFDRVLHEAGDCSFEHRAVSADGGVRWYCVNGRRYLPDCSGTRMLGTVVDITDRKRDEGQLLASKETIQQQMRMLQSMVASIADGVIVCDRSGRLVVFNPAAKRMLGAAPTEDSSESWSWSRCLYLPDRTTAYPQRDLPLARAMRGENVDALEMFVKNEKAPEGIWLSVTARQLGDDAAGGAVAVFQDVTEGRSAQEQLRQTKEAAEEANRAKSEFLSRMSHELRTPLNSILGFGQILNMDGLADRPRSCVDHIIKAGRHLLNLIDEVLDISRIEAGRLPLSPEPVRVMDCVEQAIDMVHPMAAGRGIQVRCLIPSDCPDHVLADRQRLQQVLLNLLSNAVKYNVDRGSITISFAESKKRHLRLEIADTGIGISNGDRGRLFSPFERLGAAQIGIEGTGLGLAVSKRLIEAMGGEITARSELGHGSVFSIELPAAVAPEQRVRHDDKGPIMVKAAGDCDYTVLYIEDNVANLQLIEYLLSFRPGIKLMPAMQGRLGLELARQHQPDLILLDLHLPDIGGDEVLRRLRADPQTRRIPVVMISADATPGQIERLKREGAVEYLTKPLDVNQLLATMDHHLDKLAAA